MKLIGSGASPYVRKVRVVLAEKELDYEYVLDDVWTARSTVGQANPVGKVPCLVLAGGEPIYDSRVIVEYLDALSGVAPLLPTQALERARVRTWEALADGALDAAVLARLEATWGGRTDEQRSQAWIDRQLGKVRSALGAMNDGLAGKPWCSGAHFNLCDIAVGCVLDWLDFRFPALDWRTGHAGLVRLATQLHERPSFASTMPG